MEKNIFECKPEETESKIKVIKKLEELNSLGNQLLLKADEYHPTLVLTSKFRWVSVRKSNGDYYSNEQKQFEEKIKSKKNPSYTTSINMKVLLITNPFAKTKCDDETDDILKLLIYNGADIRYKKVETTKRIVLYKNELFLSFSNSISKAVNKGLYYLGESDDVLIEINKNEFNDYFASARRIGLNKNNDLYFSDNIIDIIRILFIYNKKEFIFLIIGALLGSLLSFFFNMLV